MHRLQTQVAKVNGKRSRFTTRSIQAATDSDQDVLIEFVEQEVQAEQLLRSLNGALTKSRDKLSGLTQKHAELCASSSGGTAPAGSQSSAAACPGASSLQPAAGTPARLAFHPAGPSMDLRPRPAPVVVPRFP